jgi:hypothetical protein
MPTNVTETHAVLQARIPLEMVERVQRIAQAQQTTVSEVMRQSLLWTLTQNTLATWLPAEMEELTTIGQMERAFGHVIRLVVQQELAPVRDALRQVRQELARLEEGNRVG